MIINSTLAGGGGTELKTATATITSSSANTITFILEKSNVIPTNYWFVPQTNSSTDGVTSKTVCGYKETDASAFCAYTQTSNYSSNAYYIVGSAITDIYRNEFRIRCPLSNNGYFSGSYQLYYYY